MTTNGMFVRESGQGTPVVLVHGRFKVYPGVGHFPHIEAAAQYAADIVDFITNH